MEILKAPQFLLLKFRYFQHVLFSWRESVSGLIFMKNSCMKCAKHGDTSLILIASKLLASVILHKGYDKHEKQAGEKQFRFHAP